MAKKGKTRSRKSSRRTSQHMVLTVSDLVFPGATRGGRRRRRRR